MRERFLLDRFLEVAELRPAGILEDEAPDFVLEFGTESVGLEVTELHIEHTGAGGLSLRALESVTDRIVAAAQRQFESKHQRALFVSVCFFEAQLGRHTRRDEIASALADLVASLLQGEKGLAHWRNDYSNPELDSVAFLSAHFTPQYLHGHWAVARAGWVAPLSTPALQAAVDRKNSRHAHYTRRVSETWLLLAFDGGRPSQLFDLEPKLDLSQLRSEFARTYLLRTFPPLLRSHARSAA